VQRAVSRSTSEEIPLVHSQQQYIIPSSSLADKRSGSTPHDMMYLNPDVVRSCHRLIF
jgi:hypothetical protein